MLHQCFNGFQIQKRDLILGGAIRIHLCISNDLKLQLHIYFILSSPFVYSFSLVLPYFSFPGSPPPPLPRSDHPTVNGVGGSHSPPSNGGSGPCPGKCPHCGADYANMSSLKYHVRLVHSDAKNIICCHLCPEKFVSKLSHREHLFREHQVKYQ